MPQIIICPRCQKTLSLSDGLRTPWLTCPHCAASVATPRAAPDVDTDVRLGSHTLTVVLGALIGLNVAGITAAFLLGTYLDLACYFVVLFGVFDILVIAAVLPPVWRHSEKWMLKRRMGSVAMGCWLPLLAAALIVGVVLVFYAVCEGLRELKR